MVRFSAKHQSWLTSAAASVDYLGYAIVEDVVDNDLLRATRDALYRVQAAIGEEIGEERVKRAGELGVLRVMLRYEDLFVRYLELPQVLEIMDAVLAPTAILHLQNGFVLPSVEPESGNGRPFQQTFHMDFPRYLNGYVASLN